MSFNSRPVSFNPNQRINSFKIIKEMVEEIADTTDDGGERWAACRSCINPQWKEGCKSAIPRPYPYCPPALSGKERA